MATNRAAPRTLRENRHVAFRAHVALAFTAGARGRDTCNLVLAPSGIAHEPCGAIRRAKAVRAAPLHTVAPAQLWPATGASVFWGQRTRTLPVWPPRRTGGTGANPDPR